MNNTFDGITLDPYYSVGSAVITVKQCGTITIGGITLDKEGFYYNGEFIADAGEAHSLFLKTLKGINNA